MREELENAWKIKDYLLGQIQFSDTKASAIIAISTITVGLLPVLPSNDLCTLQIIAIVLGSTFLLLSLIAALASVFPRKNADSNRGVIFWQHISKYNSFSNYESAFSKKINLQQVLIQVYYLAKIIDYKIWWVSLSIVLQSIGLVITWITVLTAKLL